MTPEPKPTGVELKLIPSEHGGSLIGITMHVSTETNQTLSLTARMTATEAANVGRALLRMAAHPDVAATWAQERK